MAIYLQGKEEGRNTLQIEAFYRLLASIQEEIKGLRQDMKGDKLSTMCGG